MDRGCARRGREPRPADEPAWAPLCRHNRNVLCARHFFNSTSKSKAPEVTARLAELLGAPGAFEVDLL